MADDDPFKKSTKLRQSGRVDPIKSTHSDDPGPSGQSDSGILPPRVRSLIQDDPTATPPASNPPDPSSSSMLSQIEQTAQRMRTSMNVDDETIKNFQLTAQKSSTDPTVIPMMLSLINRSNKKDSAKLNSVEKGMKEFSNEMRDVSKTVKMLVKALQDKES